MSDWGSIFLRYNLKDENGETYKGFIGNHYRGFDPEGMITRAACGLSYFTDNIENVKLIAGPAEKNPYYQAFRRMFDVTFMGIGMFVSYDAFADTKEAYAAGEIEKEDLNYEFFWCDVDYGQLVIDVEGDFDDYSIRYAYVRQVFEGDEISNIDEYMKKYKIDNFSKGEYPEESSLTRKEWEARMEELRVYYEDIKERAEIFKELAVPMTQVEFEEYRSTDCMEYFYDGENRKVEAIEDTKSSNIYVRCKINGGFTTFIGNHYEAIKPYQMIVGATTGIKYLKSRIQRAKYGLFKNDEYRRIFDVDYCCFDMVVSEDISHQISAYDNQIDKTDLKNQFFNKNSDLGQLYVDVVGEIGEMPELRYAYVMKDGSIIDVDTYRKSFVDETELVDYEDIEKMKEALDYSIDELKNIASLMTIEQVNEFCSESCFEYLYSEQIEEEKIEKVKAEWEAEQKELLEAKRYDEVDIEYVTGTWRTQRALKKIGISTISDIRRLLAGKIPFPKEVEKSRSFVIRDLTNRFEELGIPLEEE